MFELLQVKFFWTGWYCYGYNGMDAKMQEYNVTFVITCVYDRRCGAVG